MTATFFEGRAERNPPAQRGYSRDQRPDGKQVCLALVVSREGLPLGYEVCAGNRNDVPTVEEIVAKIEAHYGVADRLWVMDRGMVSEANREFRRGKQRRYSVGTPKDPLRRFAAAIVGQGWSEVRRAPTARRRSPRWSAAWGDCPRKVFDAWSPLRSVDVVLPTRQRVEIRRRCVARPSPHQAILRQRLGLHLPESLPLCEL